jgi:hypothetical protein
MGSHNAGGGSRMAIHPSPPSSRGASKITWPWGLDANVTFGASRLKTAIRHPAKVLAADNREDYTGMGTTAVAVLVSGNLLTAGSAGDSRCYVFSAGKLTQITRDDSGFRRPRRGILNSDDVEHHPPAQRDNQSGRRPRCDRPRARAQLQPGTW